MKKESQERLQVSELNEKEVFAKLAKFAVEASKTFSYQESLNSRIDELEKKLDKIFYDFLKKNQSQLTN